MDLLKRLWRLPGFVLEIIRSGHWSTACNGALEILRTEGLGGVVRQFIHHGDDFRAYLFPGYSTWIARAEGNQLEIAADAPALPRLFSVLLPTYNTDPRFLREAIDSVRAQSFPRWELCIADDGSTDPRTVQLLKDYAGRDSRIRLCVRTHNGHICAASNSALELATGDFVALLDHDDVLPRHALLAVAEEIARHPDAVMIYSDEDKLGADGVRFAPTFKPDWDPDLMLQRNFVCHLGVFRTDAVRAVGGFRMGYEGSQDWDLALRVSSACTPGQIRHIPRVLYHWRAFRGSTALHINEKPFATEAGLRAVNDHVSRCDLPVTFQPDARGPFWTLRFHIPDPPPRVSIIIAPALSQATAEACATCVRDRTQYPDLEVLLAPGERTDPISATLGLAAATATGEVLCFLDPRCEPLSRDWLEELVAHALRPEIGAVGACLLNPDATVRHAGFILDPETVVRSIYANADKTHRGYIDRARLTQRFSAVGGGCLTISRRNFDSVGGFAKLRGTLAEVDLCLRLSAIGLGHVWTPKASLIVHGAPEMMNSVEDVAQFRGRWGHELSCDPAFNPNLELKNNLPSLRTRKRHSSILPAPSDS